MGLKSVQWFYMGLFAIALEMGQPLELMEKVIKGYQVSRCPGVDGLGRPKRSNNRYSENSYQQSECSCRTARGRIIDCLKVQIDQDGCNELCKAEEPHLGASDATNIPTKLLSNITHSIDNVYGTT